MSRTLWSLVLLLPAAAAGCTNGQPPPPAGKPPDVVVSRAIRKQVTDYEEFQGKSDAEKAVDVRARVSGYLDKIYVAREDDELVDGKKPPIREGTDVKKGQVLFVVQEKPFRDALTQAEKTLQGLMVQRNFNKRNAERLRTSGAGTSPTDVDTADTAWRYSEEQVGSAEAAVAIARQNLDWATIRAPFAGRIGRRMVDHGNVVKADDTILTRIVSLEPTYAYFDVDERTHLRLQRALERQGISPTDSRDRPVDMGLSDETGFPHRGTIDFTDNRVDPDSGSVWLRGVFANPTKLLTPGLFVRVRLPIGEPHQAIVIPEQALATDQGQKHVWVVDDQNHATYRQLELGAQHSSLRVVDKGIEEGERVIVSGLQKVRNDPEKHYADVHVIRDDPTDGEKQ